MPREGSEKRGNSTDRRNRKTWMLSHFGNGRTCPCTHCGRMLSRAKLEADRIIPGGSYRRDNVQPSCRRCNAQRNNNPDWKGPLCRA